MTTLLLHAPELGNTQIREGLLEMMLAMARTEDYIQQLMASEAIIAAASKKKDVTVIVQQGTDILKTLYNSTNDQIKVRALVGLCKLGASGGSDGDGSTTKLAEACRRFLVNPQKDFDLRRWAAEGLSFLTMDAEVCHKGKVCHLHVPYEEIVLLLDTESTIQKLYPTLLKLVALVDQYTMDSSSSSCSFATELYLYLTKAASYVGRACSEANQDVTDDNGNNGKTMQCVS